MFDLEINFDGISVSSVEKSDLIELQEWIEEQKDIEISFKEFFERFVEYYMSENEVFFKIQQEGRMLGLLKGRFEFKQKNQFLIWYFIIDEKFRNKGVGSDILKVIERYFIEEYDIKEIFAIVNEDNKKGVRFWKRNGFSLVRIAKNFFEKDHEFKDMFILNKNV